MAYNVTILVVNGTTSALSNINAAGDDVPAGDSLVSTLTDVELGALLATANVVVCKSTSAAEGKRRASKVLRNGVAIAH